MAAIQCSSWDIDTHRINAHIVCKEVVTVKQLAGGLWQPILRPAQGMVHIQPTPPLSSAHPHLAHTEYSKPTYVYALDGMQYWERLCEQKVSILHIHTYPDFSLTTTPCNHIKNTYLVLCYMIEKAAQQRQHSMQPISFSPSFSNWWQVRDVCTQETARLMQNS